MAPGSKEVHLNKTQGLSGRHLEHNLMLSLCSENVDQIMHDGDMISRYENLGAWDMSPGSTAETLTF